MGNLSLVLLIVFIASALVAALGYATLLYWADRYEKEPMRWLVRLFLWGALVATTVSYFATLMGEDLAAFVFPSANIDLISSVFLAPIVEETAKGLALLGILLWNFWEVHSLLDGFLYGAIIGLGFEATENALYMLGAYLEGDLALMTIVGFTRIVLFGFTHGLFTGMTGIGAAVARMYASRFWAWLALPLGWALAVFLHMTHNALASLGLLGCWFLGFMDWGALALVVYLIWHSLQQEAAWIREYLQDEVAAQRITLWQWHAAQSLWLRIIAIQKAYRAGLSRVAFGFYESLVELAYLKAQARRTPDDPNLQKRIAVLRHRVALLSQQLASLESFSKRPQASLQSK